MSKEKVFIIFLIILIAVIGCSSKDAITGKTAPAKESIYEESQTEQQAQTNESEEQQANQINESIQINESEEIEQVIQNETQEELNQTVNEHPKTEEFKFQPTSIVSTQNNISLSLDDFKYEIKDGYWGKIIEITMTVLNKGNKAFKPKVIVLLYDEADLQFSKEERTKPKAEIQFDDQLNVGEHVARYAIVDIAFNDLNLTKNFKLVLVDAADLGNKPIVVVETEFKPT